MSWFLFLFEFVMLVVLLGGKWIVSLFLYIQSSLFGSKDPTRRHRCLIFFLRVIILPFYICFLFELFCCFFTINQCACYLLIVG